MTPRATSTTVSRSAPGEAASAPLMGRDGGADDLRAVVARAARRASFRTTGVPEWSAEELVPAEHLRAEPTPLAEVSERDLVAHFTRLTHRQYSVDLGAYPLGLVHDEVQPEAVRRRGVAAGPGQRAPGRARPR